MGALSSDVSVDVDVDSNRTVPLQFFYTQAITILMEKIPKLLALNMQLLTG
jgi:hypothetical protein